MNYMFGITEGDLLKLVRAESGAAMHSNQSASIVFWKILIKQAKVRS